jgi:hypothetical protein
MHGDVSGAWAQGFTGRGANITVVDDFGHHPTAIRETLRALPSVVEVIKSLIAGGRTPEEILAALEAWGNAPRPDVDTAALAEAARIRGQGA